MSVRPCGQADGYCEFDVTVQPCRNDCADCRGSLLTKGNLCNHFYRADARHEISWRQKTKTVSENVHSANL